MARIKTGSSSIIKLARKICRLKTAWGGVDLSDRTSPEFAAAINALVTACLAFEALDDYPAQIDRVSPYGPEDLPPP